MAFCPATLSAEAQAKPPPLRDDQLRAVWLQLVPNGSRSKWKLIPLLLALTCDVYESRKCMSHLTRAHIVLLTSDMWLINIIRA